MPHAIFEIDELVETSPSTAVSFAVTCRSFEEPALRSLWKLEVSLTTLVRVLSNRAWVKSVYGFKTLNIERDPPAEDWSRLQRYASWARELCLGYREEVTDDTLRRLSSNSPGGVLCPNLERLHWSIAKNTAAPPFLRLFLSPHLKEITLCTSSYTIDVPSSLPAAAAQIISLLPTSLEAMSVECFPGQDETLTDVISSFICQCGSSPRSFNTRIPLSEAAIQHVMQLPNLRSWTFTHEPPQIPLTPIFPSLEVLDFYIPKALPWLHILASHQKGTIENLEYISFPIGTIVDPTLLSSIITFRNLVALRVGSYCSNPEGCTFRLTDNDMENLAAALPRLGTLELGKPCGFNSCSNTVASLLSISIHCLDLTVLETHLNTRTIASDMQRLLDRGAGCDKAKCELSDLTTGYFPTELPEGDIETVMMGFKAIFPHLESNIFIRPRAGRRQSPGL